MPSETPPARSDDGTRNDPQPAPSQPAPNAFDRFFPGPGQGDAELGTRLRAIAEQSRQRAEQRRQEARQHVRPDRSGAQQPPSPASDAVVDALHEQTEVLRGLLEAEIAVRDDARATAQNSRTFAVAGTVIALFTMIAAVVTVVIAFTAG